MNRMWTRLLRSAYRKEPISSFILTAGVVNAAIGGVDQEWTLMALGLSTIAAAIILRWWIRLRKPIQPIQDSPIRYLPERSSRQSLPLLTSKKRS